MSFYAPKEGKISTVLLRIPHISHLLVFNDALKCKQSMVAVIVNLLKLGLPEILYTGYDANYQVKDDLLIAQTNSAVIKICIPGKEIIRRDPLRTMNLLLQELEKPRIHISVKSEQMDVEKSVISVALTVESIVHFNKFGAMCSPYDFKNQ